MEDEAPFEIEPLFANGTRVFTLDQAIVIAKVPYGADCGFTELQARSWAALLAQAPAMAALVRQIATGLDCGFDSPLTRSANDILAACAPKPKGLPFKRDPISKADFERTLS